MPLRKVLLRKIRIATDCSGIEAPLVSLKNLAIPFTHIFSSEIDKYAIQSINANFEPGVIYDDMTTRDNSELPDIDLYIAGFPCQPFSHAGQRKGMKDDRGNIFWSCLDVIKAKRPKYFILENVPGLLTHDKGKTWQTIWDSLTDLDEYSVDYKVLNSKHYGIPQNRQRLFLIGIKSKDDIDWTKIWPKHRKMDDLKNYVDWSDTNSRPIPKYAEKQIENCNQDAYFIDLGFRNCMYTNGHLYTGTINANCHKLWCLPLQRYANVKELLKLQGFPEDFNIVVSKTQIKRQLGNSMTVNVMEAILENLLAEF